jgi:hypothetical protein
MRQGHVDGYTAFLGVAILFGSWTLHGVLTSPRCSRARLSGLAITDAR